MSSSPATIPRDDSNRSLLFLDGLRGLAALYVIIFHATKGLVWEGFYGGYVFHPQQYSIPGQLVAYALFLFYYGHQAVLLFFILSGFVIHLRYARQRQTQPQASFDLGHFYWRRFKRIYPALILALILTYVLDTHGILLVPAAQPIIAYVVSVHYDPILSHLFGTLIILPSPLPWGSDLPLWSLRLEWWYYLLYPVLWWLSRRSLGISTLFIMTLCTWFYIKSGDAISFGQEFVSLLLVWWFGALLAEIYVGTLKIKFSWLAPLALLLVPLLSSVAPFMEMNGNFRDILWGIGFAGLFATLFAWQRRGGSLRWLEWFKSLGNMSYTLYIVHMPIMVFIGAWLIAASPTSTLPMTYEWVVASIIICLVIAWLLHFIVEKPFQRRSAVKAVLLSPSPKTEG